jgi:protein NrfD
MFLAEYYSHPPEWTWLVILYFFLGGIAGGSYFLAALLDLFGDESDRPLARLGYYVALPAALLCAPLLTFDLKRPERFWHMLFQSERLPRPIFKYWSPMSVGAWALLIFGAFTLVFFVAALAEAGVLRWSPARTLNNLVRRGSAGKAITALGGLFAFFLASYTGVLLAVTNRPIWADTWLLGLLFLTSGASTAAAVLLLLGKRRGAASAESLGWLTRMDTWVMVMELVVLALVVVSLGSVAKEWLNGWGVLLGVGVVLAGILVPLGLHWRPRTLGALTVPVAAVLALAGGFILRVVVVMSSESL